MKHPFEKFGKTSAEAEYALCCDDSNDIRWVSKETDSQGVPLHIRIPEERTTRYPYPGSFTAAGKRYQNWDQLCMEEDESGHLCRDLYGRRVFCCWERYPCFDSFDFLYESRYFRWFFLLENGRLTRIYRDDGRQEIQVTEDVRHLESKCRKKMQELEILR